MEHPRVLAIGDNVCDKYLSRGKMYPGGQCVNIAVFAGANGIDTGYLGKFGDDEVARCVESTLRQLNVDTSRCRHFHGENGFACVTLEGNDRVFIGSNKGGVAGDHPFDFTAEDMSYARHFDLLCTNLNSYIENDLALLHDTGIPIAFDFSTRWDDAYLSRVCPHIKIAVLSCAHLSTEERLTQMQTAADLGVPVVLGTVGEAGSWLLYKKQFLFQEALCNDHAIDTMGAGDAYFAAFISSVLKRIPRGCDLCEIPDAESVLMEAMHKGAEFSAYVCGIEGAFGHGVPITGRIIKSSVASSPSDIRQIQGKEQ